MFRSTIIQNSKLTALIIKPILIYVMITYNIEGGSQNNSFWFGLILSRSSPYKCKREDVPVNPSARRWAAHKTNRWPERKWRSTELMLFRWMTTIWISIFGPSQGRLRIILYYHGWMNQLMDDVFTHTHKKSIYMSAITNLHVYQFNLDLYRESKENEGVFVIHDLLHTATLTSRGTVWNCQSIQHCGTCIIT